MNKAGLKQAILGMSLLLTTHAWTQAYVAGDEITIQVWEYALIDTNHAPISLSLISSVPGAPVEPTSNSDLYVKISSVIPRWIGREISARISSGSVPNGTKITLVSAPATTANSDGDLGNPVANPITLSNSDKILVTSISTCYTGTGYNDGYRMTFTWSPIDLTTNYSLITSSTYNITVVFTLSAF